MRATRGATLTRRPRASFSLGSYSSPVQNHFSRVISADLASGSGVGTLEIDACNAIAAFIDGLIADNMLAVSNGIINQATSKIKAACIMAGARTPAGALTPLVGPAPTAFNIISDNYSRKTGIGPTVGSAYLQINRLNNDDPQNNNHNCVFVTERQIGSIITGGTPFNTGDNYIDVNGPNYRIKSRDASSSTVAWTSPTLTTANLVGTSRASSSGFTFIADDVATFITSTSQTPSSKPILVFARMGTVVEGFGIHRIGYYGAGESINLSLLNSRLKTLFNSLATALP